MPGPLSEQIDAFLAAAEQLRAAIVDYASPHKSYSSGRTEYTRPIRDVERVTGISRSSLDRILRSEQDLVPAALRARAVSRRRDQGPGAQLAGQTAIDLPASRPVGGTAPAATTRPASGTKDLAKVTGAMTASRVTYPRCPTCKATGKHCKRPSWTDGEWHVARRQVIVAPAPAKVTGAMTASRVTYPRCPTCKATGKRCKRPSGHDAAEWHVARRQVIVAPAPAAKSRGRDTKGRGARATSTRSRKRDEEPHDDRLCHEHKAPAVGTLTTERGGRRRVCRQAGCGDYFATAWAPWAPNLWCVNIGGSWACHGERCPGCRPLSGMDYMYDGAIRVDLDRAV